MHILKPSVLVVASCLPLLLACEVPRDWLVVETEVQDLCVVDLSTDFEGATEGVVSQVIGGDDLGITLSEKFSATMFLRGFGVSAKSGVQSVDFIDRLRVEISVAGQEGIELLNYQGGDTGESLFVASESAVDIAAYLESEDLELLVEFAGDLPTSAWTANMEVCVSAQAAYRESL